MTEFLKTKNPQVHLSDGRLRREALSRLASGDETLHREEARDPGQVCQGDTGRGKQVTSDLATLSWVVLLDLVYIHPPNSQSMF